jgi:acyl carrier protein
VIYFDFNEFVFFFADLNLINKSKMSEIKSKVIEIIVDKLNVEEAEVTDTASFTNDLGADSLDTVELIMEFEKQFGISIPDDKAETIQTVGDAVSYIEENAK